MPKATHTGDPLATGDGRVVAVAAALYYAVVLETHGEVGPVYESLSDADRAYLEAIAWEALRRARAWRDITWPTPRPVETPKLPARILHLVH